MSQDLDGPKTAQHCTSCLALYFHHFLANKLASFLSTALFNMRLSDVEVRCKMIRREMLQSLRLSCNDLGIEIQMSRGRVYEVGINYYGRTYAEGKRINGVDGVKSLW